MAPEILVQLSEHSSRGFLLFTTSANGEIECYCHVDDEITKVALTTHAIKVLSMQSEIDDQILMNGMIANLQQEEKAAKRRRKKGGDEFPGQ